ncbi:hypothetical protein C0989_005467 [Termitomyces sp. Mn162]|nr:hypothetical protein C0989_005467 [Termitomyces sp. Mn162]
MVEQCFSAKEKGKDKAKEPKPSTAMDEQVAHLLQWLHEARVPEDVGADVLNNFRVLPVPYDDDVSAGDDQMMDKHPDFMVPSPVAGPSNPAVAKARLLELAMAKAGPSRSATTKAGNAKPAITPVVADNPVVLATPIAFLANMPWESEVGMIEVLE